MIQVNDGWRIQVQYLGNFKKVLGLNMFKATTHGTYPLTGMEYEISQNNRHTAAAAKACWDLQGGRPRCKLLGLPFRYRYEP